MQKKLSIGLAVLLAAACSTNVDNAGVPTLVGSDAGAGADATPEEGDDGGAPGTDAAKPGAGQNGKCKSDADCKSGFECLAWPGGAGAFCAAMCSTKSPCQDGERCAKLGDSTHCGTECQSDTDCPSRFVCASTLGICVGSCSSEPTKCGKGLTCGDDGWCYDESDPPPPPPPPCTPSATSGVTGSKTLGSLASGDKTKICDWEACTWGGYGKNKTCTGGPVSNVAGPKDLASCLAEDVWTKCASLTVASLEGCQKKLDTNPCDALTLISTDPACVGVKACAF